MSIPAEGYRSKIGAPMAHLPPLAGLAIPRRQPSFTCKSQAATGRLRHQLWAGRAQQHLQLKVGILQAVQL